MIYKKYDIMIKEEAEPLFSKSRDDYKKKVIDIDNKFKIALFREYNVEDNNKNELLWKKCWELGHSGGYSEIEIYFDDLVCLIEVNKDGK